MTDHTYVKAFSGARAIISNGRALEIIQLKNWEHGMCGCVNATKPDVPPLSANEDRLIHELWNTLPGSSCWMTALFLLASEL